MECPVCHKSGSAIKRIFSKRGSGDTRFCIYCNSEVRVNYKWGKIFLLTGAVILVLILVNVLLQYIGWPGISGGIAGGIAGAVIAISMSRPPFVEIELVEGKKKKNKK